MTKHQFEGDPFREWVSLYTSVLVTGSREWPHREAITLALDAVDDYARGPKLLISGGYGYADLDAEYYARRLGWDTCVVKANWRAHGKRAGYKRNLSMVRMRPKLCLAFIQNQSKGATMCAKMAEDHCIPVVYYRDDEGVTSATAVVEGCQPDYLPAVARSLASTP